MRKLRILFLVLACIDLRAQIGTFSFDKTFGSSALEEPGNTFFKDNKTYIFGSTALTAPNGNISTTYSSGDVYASVLDSVGTVKITKTLGGFGKDQLIKVIMDDFGFWVYINSYSTVSGSRTIVMNCPNSNFANNDLYIVRLDKSLNVRGEYSCCMGTNIFGGVWNNPGFSVYSYSDITKTPSGKNVILAQFRNQSSEPRIFSGIVRTDSIGVIEKVGFISGEPPYNNYYPTTPITGWDKLKQNKVIAANDSIIYVLGNTCGILNYSGSNYTIVSMASVYRRNINSTTAGVYQKYLYSQWSETTVKTGFFSNGKLYLFIEDYNLTSGPTDNLSYMNSSGIPASQRWSRTAPTKTTGGKRDVWCVALDSNVAMSNSTQFAVGCNDHTDAVASYVYNGSLILGTSTRGGVSTDKTSANNGGYDYWVVKIDAGTNQVVDQYSAGGAGDDLLTDVTTVNGVTVMGGRSKSGISGTKTEASLDGSGFGDSWTVALCSPPSISFTSDKNTINAGELVSFTNTSRYASSYVWDFQDGSYSYDMNPKHYYYTPGNFGVTLKGTSLSCFATQTYGNFIIVGPPTVGVEEYAFQEGNVFYPNPAETGVKVNPSLRAKRYVVFNSMGEEVLEGSVESNQIDVTDLAAGMYVLALRNDEKTVTTKLIKK